MESQSAPQQLQLAIPLPYAEIEPSVSRNAARVLNKENGGRAGRETLHIDATKIIIREGFNWRIKPEGMSLDQWLYDSSELNIQGLGEQILQVGRVVQPIMVDLVATGEYYLTDGFRRVMAIRWLLDQGYDTFLDGSPIHLVEAFINSKETTELDRMVAIFTTQDNVKLKPMELAMGLRRIKEHYELTHEEIGKLIGKSRQFVDNKIGLTEEPEPIRNAIISGQLTETAATALRTKVKSETERVHQVEESIAKNKALKVKDVQRRDPVVREMSQEQLMIDASEEKQMAEFACNEAISITDKMRKHWKGLPPQTIADLERLADIVINKIDEARTFIQQAPDKR